MPFEVDVLEPPAAKPNMADRRRPDRMEVAPALVPLLRDPGGPVALEDDFEAAWAPREALAPPRGIALAVVLCIPVWCGIGGLLYSVMK